MEEVKTKLNWWKDPSRIIPLFIGVAVPSTIFIYTLSQNDKFIWLGENWQWVIPYWLLLLFVFGYILVGFKTIYKKVTEYNSNSRVAILLPISCSEGYENDDLVLMAEGFGEGLRDFMSKRHKELSETYEVVFIDNKYYNSALKTVKEELENGTKFFISTLSSFSTRFSNEFVNLSKDAILINTISGSSTINETKNRVYNFYPNAISEINTILNHVRDNNFKRPYIYCYESTFTQECKEHFIKKWNELNSVDNKIEDEDVSFDFANNKDIDIKHPEFYNTTVANCDSIYIFGYGNSFYDIINELKSGLPDLKNKHIYTISTFKYREWNIYEKESLNELSVFTVRPKMKQGQFLAEKDVVKYFSEQTLDRLLNSLEKINSTRKITFDKAWELSRPRKLDLDNKKIIQVETIKI